MAARVLADPDRKLLTQIVADMKIVEDDIRKAMAAGVPKLDDTLAACVECGSRAATVKAEYFSTKR